MVTLIAVDRWTNQSFTIIILPVLVVWSRPQKLSWFEIGIIVYCIGSLRVQTIGDRIIHISVTRRKSNVTGLKFPFTASSVAMEILLVAVHPLALVMVAV